MEVFDYRPLAAVLVSLVGTAAIVALHRRPNYREAATMLTALAKFGIVASMLPAVLAGTTFVWSFGTFVPGVEFALRADPLGMLFAFLASGLWIITSLYSIGYMRGLDEHGQTRYFASFAVSLSATMGIAFASNLVTIFVFYELLSVATYPLVAHDEDDRARSAGRKYIAYTFFGGGVLVLAGTVLTFWLTGTTDFTAGGIPMLADVAAADPWLAKLTFVLLAVGFGVKAGLMPLHQWLPEAMVAPTPVSGLLHAVAVVKSGAFGVARVTLDVFGPQVAFDLGMGLALSVLAAFTLTAASLIAIRKDHLKQRLAYSTVSQLSYIVLGLGLFGWYGLIGALLHIPAHAFMKLTLFFCAGAIHVETHTDYISKMAGIGKRMPVTMGAFAITAAGMAGMPLLAGFVSKYYMLIGAAELGGVFLYLAGALLVSGVLNVVYFWPVVYTAFFEAEDDHDAKPLVDGPMGGERRSLLAATDGGRPPEDDTVEATGEETDGESPRIPDAEGEEDDDVIQPDFSPGERDFSEPAPTVDTGDYAVDQYPSDHLDDDHEDRTADRDDRDEPHEGRDETHEGHDETHEGHDEHHHGGPPSGGWRRLSAREALSGRETTWFMLGPILAAALGAVLLGIVPYRMVFLGLIELIVENAGVLP
ncbi:multicomponent Na+:H+ antiporter subunit D [Halalkaliarchaeum desulfuricum]|uniref:Multicomponent Na+:H+ antiporter subunit D n=1 Tax=Halalkaliarchaeum desulfuricum TaxID=2055893 RepID=A0A343TIS9_9EURY|nr:cation:proton antiporter [Halalkaliarchaeum desulfuricum]AUX09001.1 multicomponent Na+:H+ antiporter subunit D [Halalkaliarchaeum desulfuricum]